MEFRKILRIRNLLTKCVIALGVIGFLYPRFPLAGPPDLIAPNADEVARSLNTKHQGILEVLFDTTFFDLERSFLAKLLSEIPSKFPEYKLNTVARGLHSTVLYLEDLTLEETFSLISRLKNASPHLIEKYNLNRKVMVVDPQKVDLGLIGVVNVFLAIKPHAEFIQWQKDFWSYLKEVAPDLVEKHRKHRYLGDKALTDEAIHISLIQWDTDLRGPMPEHMKTAMVSRMKGLMGEINRKAHYSPVYFSMADNGLKLVTPPKSILNKPINVASIRINYSSNTFETSPIVRWEIETVGGKKRVVEFHPSPSSNGIAAQSNNDKFNRSWLQAQQSFEQFPFSDLVLKLPSALRGLATENLLRIQPSYVPALHDFNGMIQPSLENFGDQGFFTTNQTHPFLTPSKAVESFSIIDSLQLRSTGRMNLGAAIYASSVRLDVDNPGDVDMLFNTIIHVPNEIQDFETARRQAVRTLLEDFFTQIDLLIKDEVIHISEYRVGSLATMGYDGMDSLKGLSDNPYLTERNYLERKFTDNKGKTWSLEELLLLEDFSKLKIDVFKDGKRYELSLQLLIGFNWKGHVYSLQRSALKGVMPLMRTAIYRNAESYAVAILLQKPSALYVTQKNSIVIPRTFVDLTKATSRADSGVFRLTGKFLKKFYNFFMFLENSGLGLDHYFFTQINKMLQKDGKPEVSSIDDLIAFARKIFNDPFFKHSNHLKRIFNDFTEYNERGQGMHEIQVRHRLSELKVVTDQMVHFLPAEKLKPFLQFSQKMARMSAGEQVGFFLSPSQRAYLQELEKQSARLEDFQYENLTSGMNISHFRNFLVYFMNHFPRMYVKYFKDRNELSADSFSKLARAFDMSPTDPRLMENSPEEVLGGSAQDPMRDLSTQTRAPLHSLAKQGNRGLLCKDLR